MPKLTSQPLARRLVVPFAMSVLVFTAALIAAYLPRALPRLGDQASVGAIAKLILLSMPFIVAMTIPMAVFVAVLWVCIHRGAERGIDVARQEGGGVRAVLMPVIGFATGIAALMLVWNAELLPRANARLVEVTAPGTSVRGDRTMTLGELRAAARDARTDVSADVGAARRVARYEVEVQKKLSLAAACLALAFAAAAVGLRFPRGGAPLLVVTSLVVFGAYYACIVTGETLANRLVVSPFIGMWTPNVLLVIAACLVSWRGGPRGALASPTSPKRAGDATNDATNLAFARR